MLVHVHAVEEKFKSSLQVDPEEPIKALFPKLSAKLKVHLPRLQQFSKHFVRISAQRLIN